MAEYIDREAAIKAIKNADCDAIADGAESYDLSYLKEIFFNIPAADVAPVVHGKCPICSGRKILTQDCDNGYSVEVDAEQGEMSVWQGDTCLTVISINHCPECGAKMDGGAK